MSSPYVKLPAADLAVAAEFLRQEQIAAALLADADRPLTSEERQALERSLRWWQQQYEVAVRQFRAIAARLAR
jgi:hypothetical protein